MKKLSLADQLDELSNPRPVTFHPDQEDLEDITAAKVCSFDEEESEEDREIRGGAAQGSGRRRRVKYLDEDDAKYAGKAISRKELDTEYEGKLVSICSVVGTDNTARLCTSFKKG